MLFETVLFFNVPIRLRLFPIKQFNKETLVDQYIKKIAAKALYLAKKQIKNKFQP